MDRKLGRLVFPLFLAVSASTSAETLQERSSSEVCVDREAFDILGGAFEGYSQEAYSEELARRGEACEPRQFYADMARQTIRNIVQLTLEGPPQQYASQPQQPQGRSWSQRIGDASRAYLQMQQEQQARQRANAPVTTNCINTTVGVSCTTR